MLEKSYAKVNIFLKITGIKEFNGKLYHTLNSRFMLVKKLYDTVEFVPQKCETFTIEGMDIPKEENIIYKAYKLLNEYTGDLDILEFFYNHKVVVNKKIPMGAGLGGGSSNAATFIKMVKKVCNLKISYEELAEISSKIGADIPFFLYGYSSANVSGFGEIIEEYKEKSLDLEIFTPKLLCNTAKVYAAFKDNFLDETFKEAGKEYLNRSSEEILKTAKKPHDLNDLYRAALLVYPELKQYENFGFFSGSGSSFFKIKGS